MGSQSKYRTVADYEYGIEVKARWQPIVQAAGLYHEKQTPESVYLLAGTIIGDPLYTERINAMLLATVVGDGTKEEDWLDAILLGPLVLEQMTKQELAALRNRVLAHWGKK
jgi:hypothetical protein